MATINDLITEFDDLDAKEAAELLNDLLSFAKSRRSGSTYSQRLDLAAQAFCKSRSELGSGSTP